jgi:MoaA/NifB/PqqE/SkfB family radical SAM enzyme
MDHNQLLQYLRLKFDIIGFYDLADAVVQHRSIFDIFKLHYQSEFLPTQRIVFYTEHCPSQLTLNHLQRAAAKIDISNCFITICTPHNISQELNIANKKYGNSSDDISFMNYNIGSTKPLSDKKIYAVDSLCPLPFSMLFSSTNNRVTPCCNYTEKIGDLDTQTLKEIFFSKDMSELRNSMKSGKKSSGCNKCWDLEEKNSSSMRQQFVNKYMDQCDQGWFDDLQIRDLTLAPSNLCNFKCRICSPRSSSKIAVEEFNAATSLSKKQELKKYIVISEKTNPVFDEIGQLSNTLESLHILGGEPLAWPQLSATLDKIIESGNAKRINLILNTNGSWNPASLIEKFLKFKSVEILISIDDIGERFELQRGGIWEEIYQHICLFKSYESSTFKITISITVNVQNVLYLDQLFNFCNQLNLNIFWNFVDTPKIFSIDHMTQTAKDLVYQKYKDHVNTELRAIADRMYLSSPTSGKEFIDYMIKLDQRRGQNSSVVLKEIFDAMSD